jgi:hypothetical protein
VVAPRRIGGCGAAGVVPRRSGKDGLRLMLRFSHFVRVARILPICLPVDTLDCHRRAFSRGCSWSQALATACQQLPFARASGNRTGHFYISFAGVSTHLHTTPLPSAQAFRTKNLPDSFRPDYHQLRSRNPSLERLGCGSGHREQSASLSRAYFDLAYSARRQRANEHQIKLRGCGQKLSRDSRLARSSSIECVAS